MSEKELQTGKLKRISQKEARAQEMLNINKRFIEEVDRICLDGRVKSLTDLESDLLLYSGKLSEFERGKTFVDAYTIARAKRIYNIDWQYVLLNIADPEHSTIYRGGKRLDMYEPFNRKERNARAKAKRQDV